MFGWLVGQLVGRSVGWLVGCSAWYVSSIFMSITSCYLPNNPTVYRLLFLFYRGSNKTNAYPKAHCWCLDRVQKAWVANGYRQGSSAHKLPAPNVHQEIQREKAGPHQSWALPEKTHRRKATGNLPSASCHIALCCPDLQAPWHEETPLPSHNLLWDWLDNSSKVLWREVMEETPCICVWVDSQGSSDEFKANEWVCSDYWLGCFVWERNCFPAQVSYRGCQNHPALLHTQACLLSAWLSHKEKETNTVNSTTDWSMKCGHQSVSLVKNNYQTF